MQLKQKAQVPCRAQALASERGQGLSCASAQGLSWTSGQGTIEYLVILAVIVVLGLVIVSLISNIMISPTEQISSTTDKLNATSGPITILDSVTDSQGGTLLRFRNNTGESITLTKISLDGVENDFSERVSLNDSRTLSLNSLVGCSGGKKSYKVIIYYTTQNGLTKTLNLGSKIIDCTQEITIPPEAIQTNSCFARGNGTLANPKIICTCSDLQNMDQNKTAYYSLGQDINCAATSTWNDNAGFTPVGNVSDSFCESQDCPEGLCCNNSVWNCESWCGSVWNSGSFSGSLNGNNHSILGLYINRSDEDNVGLFGFLSETTNQTISNIRFSDANIIGHDNVGVLAGNNGYQIASLSNIFITNSNVRGNDSVGSLIGLAGSWWGGSADAVSFEGNIFGHDNLGGLIGNANQFSITNSTATGIVSGNNNIGGIIGAGGRITTGSTTFMDVNGNQNVGGAAGSGTNISSTIAYGDVNGVTNVGGLIGSGTAVSSSASGNVLGQDYVGGLAGITSALTDSNSIGNVTGRNYVGGLAGSTSGTITRCSSESRVNGAGYVSGLVGYATSITINF
ncbi:MAG: GLUG motif-containing protein, partial [archaeon]